MKGPGDVGPGAIAQVEQFGAGRAGHVEVVEQLVELTIDGPGAFFLVAKLPQIRTKRIRNAVQHLVRRDRQPALDPAEMGGRDARRLRQLMKTQFLAEAKCLDRRANPLSNGRLVRHPQIAGSTVILGEGLSEDARILL